MENSSRIGRKSRKLGSRRQYRMREVHDEDAPDVPDTEQLPSQATEELQDFFQECGADHKGFVTREDLGKAKFSFLGSPEELELIFDWMDLDRKGRLTLKEFTSGLKNVFSSQTKIPRPRKRKTRTWIFSKEEPTSLQSLEEADPEEKRWFLSFMEQLGADHSFLDQAEIWQLWKNLRQEEPHLVGNLEGFLAKVTSRLQETRAEKEALQMTLKKCDDDHHREVRQLYEELEQQIHSEKQRLQAASNTQGLAYSSMMHQALEAKEQEVQHLAKGQRELEAQIDLLRSKRQEVSMENQRLQETQKDLTGQLEQVRGQLQVTRGHLNLAKGQVSWQVEEKTSLTSDPPVGPKNTSGSQHLDFFPEEDPLPSLFEEEHGVLQDQSPDEVQRAEDRGLQSQAQEGSLFPKDGSGNTLDPEDSGQGLSIMVEAGAQAGSKVLGQQITATSLEPREEKRSGVIEETNLKIEAKRATASLVEGSPDPDYLFHVLFLGDSNVGKTTFLYLLHHNSFATGLAATVGMDYQIKNLVVDNRRFALQLWDTAGQERYHSITKQFLRKADGIVLMYDVTCPESFLHVRYWLDCLQEAGADDVAILLLGNKTDCVEERQVSTENGQLLAKEIGVAFGECSAALGHNILEPIVTLARAMQEQDNRLRHNLVDLEKKEVKKKAGCCS
ncbi:ras-related protein Rab-44 isoform X3 [Monodelphis domestica]|uniref:ras-related protein Rab-44 isoform X3 n=1 Tax=Monodelphis domestica TaxID=13616 RepID=UPI0024E25BFB|nr:ras-related protein Rab-44 isoform X3 [Monodelphis domestica]